MRLIDADTTIHVQIYDDMTEEWRLKETTVATALDYWADEGCPPTIDAIPIKYGHWKINYLDDIKVNKRYVHITCSECKADVAHDWEGKSLLKTTLNYNYCPNCGADMKGEQE